MSLLITEFAIQSDGTFAIEIFNSGSDAVVFDSRYYLMSWDGVGFLEIACELDGIPQIAPGETVSIGHSSIANLSYYPNDQGFVGANLIEAFGIYIAPDNAVDFIRAPTVFDTDLVYESQPGRGPNNGLENISDFTQITGFSNNSLMCFSAGTKIAVPRGEAAVETLTIGDLVMTADGRAVPVRWIGRQTLLKTFVGERARLVRIANGALSNHADLFVTGDHGMLVDGVVVNASALVNGNSIDWVPLSQTPERRTVYHIETDAHDVILANGALSETYLDEPGRQAFDNYSEYRALYGAERLIVEMPLPRLASARLLPEAIQRRLGMAWAG